MSGGLTMLRKLILAASTAALIATPAIAQDYSLEPNFGTFSLAAGFNPDPAELAIVAGGTVDASSVGCAASCRAAAVITVPKIDAIHWQSKRSRQTW